MQTKLVGIWRPTSNMVLIDTWYGYFIMKFDNLKDYHRALMDGPWFVGRAGWMVERKMQSPKASSKKKAPKF